MIGMATVPAVEVVGGGVATVVAVEAAPGEVAVVVAAEEDIGDVASRGLVLIAAVGVAVEVGVARSTALETLMLTAWVAMVDMSPAATTSLVAVSRTPPVASSVVLTAAVPSSDVKVAVAPSLLSSTVGT